MPTDSTALLPTAEEKQQLLERRGLPRHISEFIRDSIITGRISAGTRLVEHQLARSLGVSRVPVREALIELERAGLVVSRPNGRYVLEVGERDVHQLYEVRIALERPAVRLAATNITPKRVAQLRHTLALMADAADREDSRAHVLADFELHSLVWEFTGNPHLMRALQTLAGPIYMFMAANATHDGREIVRLHEDLVDSIVRGDADRAVASIEAHMADSLRRAQRTFDAAAQEGSTAE